LDAEVAAVEPHPLRVLMWRSLRETGLEYCGLWRYLVPGSQAFGWALRGTAVGEYQGVPTEVRYRVVCDDLWNTRSVHIGVVQGHSKRALRLRPTGGGRWASGGDDVPQHRGCTDVDLGIGASTNTLPIRRLGLAVGQSARIDAAWVRFPDLRLERLPQRYTRLAEDRYRYESLDSGFTADLEVDDLGLVVNYPGWCERVAAFDSPGPSDPQANR
jgi:hypothetical protein